MTHFTVMNVCIIKRGISQFNKSNKKIIYKTKSRQKNHKNKFHLVYLESYLERAIDHVSALRGERRIQNVNVFRESREYPAHGRHFEELQRSL